MLFAFNLSQKSHFLFLDELSIMYMCNALISPVQQEKFNIHFAFAFYLSSLEIEIQFLNTVVPINSTLPFIWQVLSYYQCNLMIPAQVFQIKSLKWHSHSR